MGALFPIAHRRLVERLDQLTGPAATGGFVVLRGEREVGLCWIVDDARARHSGRTLVGRASAATADVPLWPVHEALSTAGDTSIHLPPEAAAHPRFEDIHAATDSLVALAAETPTLLVVEHVEHADRSSLAALERLADACASLPLLCVVTLASASGLSPADELVDALLERDLAQCIDIAPITSDVIADLVRDLLGGDAPDELVAFVLDQAGGLPQVAERIVQVARRRRLLVADRGRWRLVGPLPNARPNEIVSRTARSLMAATPTERDLVVAASVLEDSAELHVLAAAAGCDLDATLDHLRACVDHELLRWAGRSVVVRNGIVRDLAVAGLTARTSLDVLARLATAASATGATGTGFARAVELLERGGRAAEAAGHRLRVASRALAHGDIAAARREVDAAVLDDVAHDERVAAGRLALEVAARGGETADHAATAMERLVAAAPDLRAWALVQVARATATNDLPGAVAHARLGAGIDGAGAAWADVLAAIARPAPERRLVLRSLLGSLSGTAASTALRHLAALELPTSPDDAVALLARAQQAADDAADRLEANRCIALRAQVEALRTGSSRALAREAAALCGRGDRTVGPALAVEASLALSWAGEADRARSLLTRAAALAEGVAPSITARAARAARMLRASEASGDDCAAGALAALLADDIDVAADHLAAAVPVGEVDASGVVEAQWGWAHALAPLVARVAARDPLPPVKEWSWTAYATAIDRLDVAAAHGATGDAAAARAATAEADAALAGAPGAQVITRRLVTELAVRDGWADRTIELLARAALVSAVQHDLPELASRMRTILRDGGFAIPRFGPADVVVPVDLRASGLTAREMEVVELLRAGRSTAEVASELFISTTTVKSHVANAARKLGYSSRRELLAGMAALHT